MNRSKPFASRIVFMPGLLLMLAVLGGCGGGGGSTQNAATPPVSASAPAAASTPIATTPPPSTGAPTTTPATSPVIAQSTIANVQPVTVASAPGLTRNLLTTSVTVCQPGTSTCVTIPNVQVDTGSQGLRLLASALPAGFSLPAVASGSGSAITGQCAVFGGGYAWGAVRSADISMAGQLASALPVQIIADAATPTVPTDCAGSGASMLTLGSLRANGILGVGPFAADCGSGCANQTLPRWYYGCDATGACTASRQPVASQVTNPVSAFALDNNGVVIDLPAVPSTGLPTVTGSMFFGIGTQANNTLGSATVLKGNSANGYVTTLNGDGNTYALSFIDSGSNGFFFPSTTLPQCGLWYCPTAPQALSATLRGSDGTTATVAYEVGDSKTIFSSSGNAFDNLAGTASGSFDWGLPMFYGRRVYTAIASRATPAGNGPYYAF